MPMMIIVFLVNLIFYELFPLLDGPILCKDSTSYITMEISREPLYPLFLKVLRTLTGESAMDMQGNILGERGYLLMAALLQALLAAYAAWSVFRLIYSLVRSWGKNRRGALLAAAAGNLCIWGPELLNRFFAERSSAYFESIMTEGLGISLFILFVLRLFAYLRNGRKKDLILITVLMFLCISLRKQLAVTVLVMGAMFFFYLLIGRRDWKKFGCGIVIGLLALACSTLFDCTYNYVERGVFMQHTGNAQGMDSVLLYTSDPAQDTDLFEEGELKDMYLLMEEMMEERGLRLIDRQDGLDWIGQTDHFASSYDPIGYEVLNPVVFEYMEIHHPDYEIPAWFHEIDRIEGQIRDVLLHQNPARFLSVYRYTIREGFVNTVLRKTHLFAAMSLVLYCLYIALFILLCLEKSRAKKEQSAEAERKEKDTNEVLLFSAIVMMSVVINTFVVGALIFPQTRYMIYNMGLFYAAFLLLLVRFAGRRGQA